MNVLRLKNSRKTQETEFLAEICILTLPELQLYYYCLYKNTKTLGENDNKAEKTQGNKLSSPWFSSLPEKNC